MATIWLGAGSGRAGPVTQPSGPAPAARVPGRRGGDGPGRNRQRPVTQGTGHVGGSVEKQCGELGWRVATEVKSWNLSTPASGAFFSVCVGGFTHL